MTEHEANIELVFVTSDTLQANALRRHLESLCVDGGAISVSDVGAEDVPGAASRECIVTALVSFSLNVAAGVVGTVLYDAFLQAPHASCTANDAPVERDDRKSPDALDIRLRALALPPERRRPSQER